eukprot:CAMPEP_0113497720 /NCGR_PEP_ID=MMETSP0014_2-20120614/30777_1 /TAXON_ID=2857 /ORGANISM="Nitzschia sp." /LENGTH=485 /DNA_ID=CAMNT_0000391671 /DNA_START=361 /DNA_END=1818 /DNA_ORIENTATION=- /assembly_acc=CAM_ASM_000159
MPGSKSSPSATKSPSDDSKSSKNDGTPAAARTPMRNNYAAPHTPIASAKRPRSSMNNAMLSPAGGAGQSRGLPDTPLNEEEAVVHPLEDNIYHNSGSSLTYNSPDGAGVDIDDVPETPGTASARETLDRTQLSPLHPAKPRVKVTQKSKEDLKKISVDDDDDGPVDDGPGDDGDESSGYQGIFSPVLNLLKTNSDDEEDGEGGKTNHTGTTSQETLSEEEEKDFDGEKDVAELEEEEEEAEEESESYDPADDVLVEDDHSSQGSGEDEEDEDEFNPYAFIKSLPAYELVSHTRPKIGLPPKDVESPPISLVLDLDETLVHCTVEPVDDADLVFPVVFHGTTYQVHVRLRPHLMEFLQKIKGKYEVVVFTASQKVYANELLNLIDPDGEYFHHRLYRESCLAVEGNFLKDLTVLDRDLTKTVLVDNSPHAFGYQIDNGIPIESWFDDPTDTELLKLERFMRSLQGKDDVRDVVRKQFRTYELVENS